MRGRFGLLMPLALLISSSAHAQKVNVDWDHDVTDFAKYKTYSWVKSHKPVPNPLMEQRIIAATDSQLAAKGLTKVETDGDLHLVYEAGVRQQRSATVTGMGGGWRVGGGFATVNQNIENVGSLVIDIVDAPQNQLIWRGVATDTLSDKPEKNAEKIKKAVAKMFQKYPPGAKK
jgi:Domain of unknown function (DUF4136)